VIKVHHEVAVGVDAEPPHRHHVVLRDKDVADVRRGVCLFTLVTQDRLSSCDVRVQLTHAAEEFGRVSLQLDGARGVCVATLRYRGQDREGIAFDLL